MNVIGHQDVGMHGTAEAAGKLPKVMQIEPVVFFGEEANRAIIAPLDDVPGNAGKRQTGAARQVNASAMD